MGYRSKVIIGVESGELSKEFDGILRKYEFPVDINGNYLKVIDTDGMKLYQFEEIKWYNSEEWCRVIMDWLYDQSCTPLNDQEFSVFCVGMGYDDGEIHSEVGDYWEYVDVIKDINLID